MRKLLLVTLIVFGLMQHQVMAQQTPSASVSMFPAAQAGMQQIIIDVPHGANDQQKKIEFYVGKMMEVDACNNFFLSGTLEEKDLQGWGYSYYEFQTDGQVAGTLMGCMNPEKVTKFIAARSEMARYNGRLPIVIYIPEGYEVRYKIWKAEDEEYVGKTIK